jgi:hypothetical protein
VVVNGELAISEPETRIPAPDTPGLAVCALLFVWTSFDEGSGISEILTCANELDAMAKNTSIVSTPTIIFDLNVICSPFKVATKTKQERLRAELPRKRIEIQNFLGF